jgi:hypothetical protein
MSWSLFSCLRPFPICTPLQHQPSSRSFREILCGTGKAMVKRMCLEVIGNLNKEHVECDESCGMPETAIPEKYMILSYRQTRPLISSSLIDRLLYIYEKIWQDLCNASHRSLFPSCKGFRSKVVWGRCICLKYVQQSMPCSFGQVYPCTESFDGIVAAMSHQRPCCLVHQ